MSLCKWALLGGVAALVPTTAQAQSSPSAFTAGTRYDAAGRVTGTINPAPGGSAPVAYGAVRNTYDAAGRLVRTETGSLASWQPETIPPASWTGFTIFRQVDNLYDGMDHKIRETASSGGSPYHVTQYSYDPVGRLQCTAVRMNAAAFASPPDACTLGAQGAYGPDRIVKNIYDTAGQLVQIRRGVGTSREQAYVTYSYTPDGKQQDVIDSKGNRATLTYDGFDRKQAWYFASPSGPASFNDSTQATALATAGSASTSDYELYAYDANDNMTSRRLRNGTSIAYVYDSLNRLQTKTLPSGNPNLSSAYSYDILGHLLSMTSSNSIYSTATTYTYDGFGRMKSEAEALSGTTHTLSSDYDADGNRIKLSWDDGFNVTYLYDFLDRMTDINENGSSSLAHFDYDNTGSRKDLNRGNGTSTIYHYDGAGRLDDLKVMASPTVITNEYTLAYTPADELSSKSISNSSFAWVSAVATNRTYASNGLNQYNGITGIATPTYDTKGNLTQAGAPIYTYNAENELATQGTYRYYYDPHHRLLYTAPSNTRLTYDGEHVATEYSVSNVVKGRYVFGPDPDEPLVWYNGSGTTDKRWLAADPQGSIVLVSNGSGTVLGINTYDEYGIPANTVDASGNMTYQNLGRFQFTGQQWMSDLAMYYYKARFYSPMLGRFMQTDPIGYGDQINLYTYVNDDPVNHVDPQGTRDLYVGGADDKNATRLVQDYAERQMRLHPDRDIQYFSWADKGFEDALAKPLARGEPLNVVGHSLGGWEVVAAAPSTPNKITNLITIDPVGSGMTTGAKPGNVTTWANITAVPEKRNSSDTIASAGRTIFGTMDTSGADISKKSGASHGDFERMMSELRAQQAIDQSYKADTKLCTSGASTPC